MKLKIALICAFLLCQGLLLSAFGQGLQVSGKVTGAISNDPLMGATVAVKGTQVVTTTDEQGNYTIVVPQLGSVLQISYAGMTAQEVTVNKPGTYNVSLETAPGSLDEVVVVGYGTQKKSVVTGAISSVKAKELEKIPVGRIEQALQGRVSGVTILQNSGQPGSPSTIRVRGITTFGGGNNPLWVIDGVLVDAGAIGYLNQSDIESIEVLKDASSAAIYGTRAATGVILVTTKKGRAGQMRVNYSGYYGVSAPAKVLQLLNATEYAALLNEQSVAGGGPVVFPDLSSYGLGTDWQKSIFNYDARRYSHEISLSGGSEKSTFYLSFGTRDEQGIVATDISNYNSKNIRLNSNHKISKVFNFGQTLGYSHQKSVGLGNTNSEFGGPLSSAINLDPITPLVVTDPFVSDQAPYSVNPVIRDANGNPYGISSIVGQEMVNPLAYIQTRLGGYNWSDDIIGNVFLEAAITNAIKVKSTLGGKLAFWGSQGFTPVYFLSATNKVSQNNYGKSTNNTFNWNIENTITFSKKFDAHNVTLLLGQGAYLENNGGGSSINLFNLPIESYQDASFGFDIPQANRTSGAYDFVQHKLSSLFARVNYNYKERYLFTGIIRRDGSSRFGENNKYGIFPSFSAGWLVDKEDFWEGNEVINSLKIRAGYGKVGNDAISDFGYLARVAGGFNYTIGTADAITTGYAPTSLDNPDLRWEETSQANVGFDAQLFRALNLTVDLYKKKTSGILRPIKIPGYVGVSSSPVGNIADMENAGIEVELGYNKRLGEVNLNVAGNVSYLKNKVTFVASDADFINGDAAFQSMGPVTRTQVGQSYNSFYGYKTAGIFQNEAEINNYKGTSGDVMQPNARPGDFRWVDVNGDGTINDDDKTFLGTNIPKYSFGLTLNADFKGIDFMVFAQGAAGSKIFQGLRRLDIGNANYQTEALGRWTGEGTSNTYPRLISSDPNGNFGKMSDFYLEDGDYLRIKILQVGYTFPKLGFMDRINASKIRLYVSAENLFTFTNYTGYDPEIGGGVFGIDKGIYPQARSVMGGIQIQF
jgi:TonB-linked SusC/RagA family outer membrane protein